MSEVNGFIVINLGCEMLYVIDQRLKAQKISLENSVQVLNDITYILFEREFIKRLIIGNKNGKILTIEHCKIILNDIASCSLMCLDTISLNKLWDLITMIFKWQIFLTKSSFQLLDITFRHLNGVAERYQNHKKTQLIDFTKNLILDSWNLYSKEIQNYIYRELNNWFEPFNVKISVLIRLGFQNYDASFIESPNHYYFPECVKNAGESIYMKEFTLLNLEEKNYKNNDLNNLMNQMNTSHDRHEKKGIFFDEFNKNDIKFGKIKYFTLIKSSLHKNRSLENLFNKKNPADYSGYPKNFNLEEPES